MLVLVVSFTVTVLTTIATEKHVLKASSSRFNKFAQTCLNRQQEIITCLELEDRSSRFQQDNWDKRDSNNDITGYGITAVLQRGEVLEKAAASTTITSGILTLERAKAISSRTNMDISKLVDTPYFAWFVFLYLMTTTYILTNAYIIADIIQCFVISASFKIANGTNISI